MFLLVGGGIPRPSPSRLPGRNGEFFPPQNVGVSHSSQPCGNTCFVQRLQGVNAVARVLKPCGTWAAYKRHLRKKEEPCGPCRQAARNQKNDRNEARKRAREQVGFEPDRERPAAGLLRAVSDDEFTDLTLDPLRVALQDLRQIEAYMTTDDPVLPNQFTNLSRRREELIDRVRSLRPDSEEGADAFDELAARRKNRAPAT